MAAGGTSVVLSGMGLTTDLARVPGGGGGLVVRACGRTMHMPEGVQTLQDVQTVLQMDLGMRDQLFEVNDSQGTRLTDDTSLQKAITAGKTPLVANLSDSSIHFIENRREELAHMQWKLVRDQNHSSSMKLNAAARQIQSLEAALEHERQDRANMIDKLKAEVAAAIEQARNESRLDLHVVEEQVAGISNMVTSERNMREVAIERTGKEMQGVRDLVEARLASVGQALNLNEAQTTDLGRDLEKERNLREAFEDRNRAETEAMIARIDEMSNRVHRSLHEFERAQQSVTNQLQDKILTNENYSRFGIGNVEMMQAECNKRLAHMEERSKSLEMRIADFAERQSEVMERLAARNEKVSQAVEALRADNEMYGNTWKNDWSKRITDLETLIETRRREVHETIMIEKRLRDQELVAFEEKLKTDHNSKIASMESRVADQFERESRRREDSVAEIMDGVVSGGLEASYIVAKGMGDQSVRSSQRSISPTKAATPRAAAVNASEGYSNGGSPAARDVRVAEGAPLTARGVYTIPIQERAPKSFGLSGSVTAPPTPSGDVKMVPVTGPPRAAVPTITNVMSASSLHQLPVAGQGGSVQLRRAGTSATLLPQGAVPTMPVMQAQTVVRSATPQQASFRRAATTMM
eukprot:TRINITY_DN35230_c0_g1_i1.p1 TRINITY_DN35230_c0_g1~~TRINITY_DN35230_c0_g1_i1.p1  ORF type:complete len:638 (+),score=191.28 TRINITY_DN35230_c0_g1_i1:111-2024(+)